MSWVALRQLLTSWRPVDAASTPVFPFSNKKLVQQHPYLPTSWSENGGPIVQQQNGNLSTSLMRCWFMPPRLPFLGVPWVSRWQVVAVTVPTSVCRCRALLSAVCRFLVTSARRLLKYCFISSSRVSLSSSQLSTSNFPIWNKTGDYYIWPI